MAGGRPVQLSYEIFSIKCRFFSNPSLDPLVLRRPAHLGVKQGYPLKSGYLSAVGLPSVKMVADMHRHIKTGDKLLRIVHIDDID